MSKRSLAGEQAKCYVCHNLDKKGNLQRCLGWHLVKRLEDDAREYNQLQELSQAQDDELESQRKTMQQAVPHQEAEDNVHVDILDISGANPFQPHHGDPLHPAGFEMQDAAGGAQRGPSNPSLTLREVPRFQLFSPSTTIFEFAGCPFVPSDLMHCGPSVMLVEGPQLPEGGVRYFHQTCLHRGEHLRHYRRVLHWSGSSNINPKKKNAGRRDMVKVTGRTALCNDCLNAFAIATNADPNEMLPKETDPERRQRKVSSRRRLTHSAKETPALEEEHNMVFSLYVTANNHFELKETSSFAALRASAPGINSACEALELAIRSHLGQEPALEHHCSLKRQRDDYEAGCAQSQAMATVDEGASLDIAFASLDNSAGSKALPPAASDFGQHEELQPSDSQQQEHVHLSVAQQSDHIHLSDAPQPEHVNLSDVQQPEHVHLSDAQQPDHVHLSDGPNCLAQNFHQTEFVLQ